MLNTLLSALRSPHTINIRHYSVPCRLLAIGLFVHAVAACTDVYQDEKLQQPELHVQPIEPAEGAGSPMKLGKKLANPYTAANMRAALRELGGKWKQAVELTETELEPTDYYIRLQANTYEEWDAIKADTNYLFLDFPIDYEIVEGGDYFHDPSVPPSVPTFNYAVVPSDDYPETALPNQYLLDELIILENLEAIPKMRLGAMELEEFKAAWERQAFQRLGYQDPKNGTGASIAERWQPSGKIETIEDDGTLVPVKGAKVVFWSFARINFVYTRLDGTFSYNKSGYLHDVKYTIKWERPDFDIRSGNFFQAWTFGPKKRGAWNNVLKAGKEQLFGDVHRAANFYYYEQKELNPPPKLEWFRRRTQIGAFDREQFTFDAFAASGSYIPMRKLLGMRYGLLAETSISIPEVKVFKVQGATHFNIVSTTLHELAHASHARLISHTPLQSFSILWIQDRRFVESWATGVEWFLASHFYQSIGKNRHTPNFVTENRNIYSNWLLDVQRYSPLNNYSPFFVDVYDNINQRELISFMLLKDNISVEDFRAFENIMRNARNFSDFRTSLLSLHPNVKEVYNEYFFQY